MLQVNAESLLDQLTTLIADVTSLHTPIISLDTNNPPLSGHAIAVGALVPPTFTGYAEVAAMAWGTPFVNSAGQAEVLGIVCLFQCTADGAANVITAVVIKNTAGTEIEAYDTLTTPITIQFNGDGFVYIPRWVLGSGS